MRHSSLIVVMALAIFCSCGNYAEAPEYEGLAATADSTVLSNDVSSLHSPSRKRIRSADIRCRVRDVLKAGAAVEQLTRSLGGVVAESTFSNEQVSFHEYPFGSDSVKRVRLYTAVSDITLRIPVIHLDTLVAAMSGMAEFIEHRNTKDTDATLSYLSNAWKNDVEREVVNNTASNSRKQPDTAIYEEDRRGRIVDRRISNLKILDDVAYSTFTVRLSQPERADVLVLADPASVMRAGFGMELATAFRSGTEWLRSILLSMLEIWPFWLALIAAFVLYRKWGRSLFGKKPAKAAGIH